MAEVRRASDDTREPTSAKGHAGPQPATLRQSNQRRHPASGSDHHAGSLSGPLGSRGFRELFGNHLFLRLWMAQGISQTIMNAANYGMIVLVNQVSKSSLATAGAVVAFSLPALFLSAPAGVLVDRFDRRLVLWVSNVLRALASAIFVLSLAISPETLWPVYALTFFIAMVGQFFTPAEGAAIPRLVNRGDLMNALALFNVTFTLAQAVGLIMLGPLALLLIPTIHLGTAQFGLTVTSEMGLFAIITMLYLVCAALVISIPKTALGKSRPTKAELEHMAEISGVRKREPQANISSILADIGDAWRFIRRDAFIDIGVWQLTLAGIIIAVIGVIAPAFVQDYFHKPAAAAALVFLPAGVGLVLGSVATPQVTRRLRYTWTIALGVALLAGSSILLVVVRGLAPYIWGVQSWWTAWPYIIIMFILTFAIGIGLDFVNVPAQTIVQERSPDWIKGRVLAVQYMLLYGATVVYVPIIGWLADTFGLSASLLAVAATVAIPGSITVYLRVRASARLQQPKLFNHDAPEDNA